MEIRNPVKVIVNKFDLDIVLPLLKKHGVDWQLEETKTEVDTGYCNGAGEI